MVRGSGRDDFPPRFAPLRAEIDQIIAGSEDIQVVFENLRKASYMHLNAFATNYQVQTGTTYQPQYMTEEEYAATQVTRGNSAMDRGAGMRAGGQGRGRGR